MTTNFRNTLKIKWYFVLFIGLLIILFTGCGASKDNQADAEEKEKTASSSSEMERKKELQDDFQEYLITKFNLTIDDFDKVNMYRFNKKYGNRLDDLNDDNIDMIISAYRDDDNMHYLIENAAEPIFETFPPLEDIRYIYLFENIGNRFKTAIFDFENTQVTYDMGGDVGFFYTTSPIKVFDEGKQKKLVDLLVQETNQWERNYPGTNGETTGHYTWRLAIQLKGYEIYRYSGYGIFNGKPENLSSTVDGIWSIINE